MNEDVWVFQSSKLKRESGRKIPFTLWAMYERVYPAMMLA